jgi:hypothetical protein
MPVLLMLLLAVLCLIPIASARAAGLSNLKLTTDKSIDCSSVQTIAADLYRGLKTDEQKAIATWYFVRRMLFHWPQVPTWDTLELINSYGYGLCGMQSTAFCRICEAGGIKARKVKAGPHMMAEAFYGGAWHLFDCQVGWYALRKDKSAVAGAAEMKKDNSIIADAVQDGRASAPYFQCSDKWAYGVSAVNQHYIEGPTRPLKWRLVLNLRRGESITRRWSNEAKCWHPPGDTRWLMPHHGCTRQSVDANDPVNWPFWKPYAEVLSRDGDNVRYGKKRYFGNGRMVYAPDLTTDHFLDAVPEGGRVGLAAPAADAKAAGLHPAAAGRKASVTFVIECPYLMVDAWLDAEVSRKTPQDAFAVRAKGKQGGWRPVYQAAETGSLDLQQVSLKKAAWGGHRYHVRFEMTAAGRPGDVVLKRLRITTVFMNNLYALPYLVPGRNTIRLTAAEPAALPAGALRLKYEWEDQGKPRQLEAAVDRLPFEKVVTVGGKEMPRMKQVTLSLAP